MAEYGLFFANIREAANISDVDAREMILRARSRGMTYMECSYDEIRHCGEDFFAFLGEIGVKVSVYAIISSSGTLLSDSTVMLTDELEWLKEHGADHLMPVVMHCEEYGVPSAPTVPEDDPKCDAVFEKVSSTLERIVRKAEKLGVTVTVEDYDHKYIPCGSCADIQNYLGAVDGLGVTFDTGNFLTHGEDIFESYTALGGKIKHVHVKDRLTLERDSLPSVVGDGVLPIGEILHTLAVEGYEGVLSAEIFAVRATEENLFRSLEYVKNHFK